MSTEIKNSGKDYFSANGIDWFRGDQAVRLAALTRLRQQYAAISRYFATAAASSMRTRNMV